MKAQSKTTWFGCQMTARLHLDVSLFLCACSVVQELERTSSSKFRSAMFAWLEVTVSLCLILLLFLIRSVCFDEYTLLCKHGNFFRLRV